MKSHRFELLGNLLPQGKVLFCAADSKYFLRFAPALVQSCIDFDQKLHIHIINRNEEAMRLQTMIQDNHEIITFTSESVDLAGTDERTYYACNRFLVASHILRLCDAAMILDIDNILMNEVQWNTCDIGLFLRDPLPGTTGWEHESTHVAAGIVSFTTPLGLNYLNRVSDRIKSYDKLRWFADQNALWKVYEENKHKMSTFVYDGSIMDWEFKPGTMLWTGKGPRKYDDPTYVSKDNELTERLIESLHS
jgi:hypothetical protein